ncbi:MAG TPA: PilZ domain-containing protein [Bryobacteraceae bacterium]|nr:PilZ domain-containing protein [Bryobacteraceae bacterium]
MTENDAPGPNAPMVHGERRKTPRVTIRRLAYVNLGPYDNGGVVTDISKDGLRFHMVNPVEQGGVVRVSILLGAANQIEAVGELIWLDAARKAGGLRFTVLPAGAAEQIIEWASNSAEIAKAAPPRGKVQDTSISKPLSNQARSESVSPLSATTSGAATGSDSQRLPGIPPQPAPMPPLDTPAVAPPTARAAWVPPMVRASSAIPNPAAASMHSSDQPAAAPPIPQPSAIPGNRQPAPMLQPAGAMPWITHFDPDPPARDSAFFRGILGGIVISALLGCAGWFAMRHYGWQNSLASFGNFGNSGVADRDLSSPPAPAPAPASSTPLPSAPAVSSSFGAPSATEAPNAASTAASSVTPAQTPAQATASTPNQATARVSDATPPQADVSDENSSGEPQSESPTSAGAIPEVARGASHNAFPQAQTHEAALRPAVPAAAVPPTSVPSYGSAAASAQTNRGDTGETQLQLARQYLDGRGRPRNATVASQLLWSAVQKGNSTAEMDLADLYLHGDGVARNCDQARVLLSVASQKGNSEAIEKLSELNRTGCR